MQSSLNAQPESSRASTLGLYDFCACGFFSSWERSIRGPTRGTAMSASSAAAGAESSSEDEILDAVAIASFAARVDTRSRFYTRPVRTEAGLGAKYIC